jgi:hypothetical protein
MLPRMAHQSAATEAAMGVGYQLDQQLGLTLTVFDGRVSGDEWRATVRTLFADPGWPPGRLNLTDLRTADSSALTVADRDEIFAINARHADKLVGMKSAAIGGAHFEKARRFGDADQSSGLRLIAFDDLGPACAWLGIELDTVRTSLDQIRRRLREPTPTG